MTKVKNFPILREIMPFPVQPLKSFSKQFLEKLTYLDFSRKYITRVSFLGPDNKEFPTFSDPQVF